MSIAYFTRITRFSATHRYWRPDWSVEQNRRAFGSWADPEPHGHSYTLETTVESSIDATTGFSADLMALDAVLEKVVVKVFDQRPIHESAPEFANGLSATCENILVYCWPHVRDQLPAGMKLYRMRLREDDALYVEYFGGLAAP